MLAGWKEDSVMEVGEGEGATVNERAGKSMSYKFVRDVRFEIDGTVPVNTL